MRPKGLRAGALLLPGLLLACTSPPANTLAPGHEGAPGVLTFVVCAPNTVLPLAAELQGGPGPIREEIETYLRSHGAEVLSLDFYEGRRLWQRSLAQAKQEGTIDRTRAIFAEELASQHDFQAIVMPSLLFLTKPTRGGHSSWDGVRRRMRTVREPDPMVGHRTDPLAASLGGPTGELPVASLHVLVFAPDGRRIFEGRGGIDFVLEVGWRSSGRRRLRPSSNLFRDREVLREAVGIAFTPYLMTFGDR